MTVDVKLEITQGPFGPFVLLSISVLTDGERHGKKDELAGKAKG